MKLSKAFSLSFACIGLGVAVAQVRGGKGPVANERRGILQGDVAGTAVAGTAVAAHTGEGAVDADGRRLQNNESCSDTHDDVVNFGYALLGDDCQIYRNSRPWTDYPFIPAGEEAGYVGMVCIRVPVQLQWERPPSTCLPSGWDSWENTVYLQWVYHFERNEDTLEFEPIGASLNGNTIFEETPCLANFPCLDIIIKSIDTDMTLVPTRVPTPRPRPTPAPTPVPTQAPSPALVELNPGGTLSKRGNRRACAWDRCPSEGFHLWQGLGSGCTCVGGLSSCSMEGDEVTEVEFTQARLIPAGPGKYKLAAVEEDGELTLGEGRDTASGGTCFDDPLRAGFSIDLTDTGFTFAEGSSVWVSGWAASMRVSVDNIIVHTVWDWAGGNFNIPAGGTLLEVNCGGWSGACASEIYVARSASGGL